MIQYTDDDGYEVLSTTTYHWGRFAKATGMISRFGDTPDRDEALAAVAKWQRYRSTNQDQTWDGWFIEEQSTVIKRKVERVGEADTIEGVPA